MRHIRKGPEPPELSSFKQAETSDWKPSYDNLTRVEKEAIWRGLWQEQGHICCYCGGPIGARKEPTDCHIDHVRPQSAEEDLRLEYGNMLGSCQGYDPSRWPTLYVKESDQKRLERPPASVHCGHKRGDWFDEILFITPLRPDCESYFRFSSSGEVLAVDDAGKTAAAKETIARLGLNVPRLLSARQEAIDTVLADPDELSQDALRKLYVSMDRPRAQGRLHPFCFAIRSVLRLYVPGL
jgi:uncharacterized protein (TIGR02646 family)